MILHWLRLNFQKHEEKFVAILLAVIAGGFGAHKFYLRQPELGISYIALFIWLGRIAGIPLTAFLGWYDAYKLLTMDNAEFDRRYNSYFSETDLEEDLKIKRTND